jgi:hypothetical protein
LTQSDQSTQSVLDRPPEQRLREHKYRFAQSVVFGLPVIALQCFGRSLGGADAPRWVGLFQALLSGWVVYVAAAGMFFEGILLIRQRVTGGLVVSTLAIGLYLASVASEVRLLITSTPWFEPLLFHWAVILLASWSGMQWFRLSRA